VGRMPESTRSANMVSHFLVDAGRYACG